MKQFKQKLLLLSASRKPNANEDSDRLNADSTGVRGSTSRPSSSLSENQANDESGPWGLKELCPGRDPLVDIVAVHGLNGHRERTWTWTRGNEADGDSILWLRDLLPERIPRARVWTWGYDSRTHTKSHRDYLTTKKLYEHGRDLVSDLNGARRESYSHQRPIIFVAHSLGGIVVKNALLHSDRVKEGDLEEERSIKLSTYGIIFMGTPHQGGQVVGLGKILLNVAKVQGDANDGLLKHLEEHSEFLQQQMSEFSFISRSFDIKFAYETKPTPLIGVIVPKWSAVVLGTPDAAEIGINADHRNMTKFSNAEDEDFKKLSRILESMFRKSGPKVEGNWDRELCTKQAIMPKSSRPIFMVPFERDSKFVGCMDIIAELDQILKSRNRVALAGIGGVGKSQIAIEYCYKFRDRHPDASIFWVHVGTISRFKQAYETIAKNLGLVGINNPEANNTLQLVTDWFNNEDNGNWLMILDNADDKTVFESRSQSKEAAEQCTSLFRYIPHNEKGSIIITTRDKRVGESLTSRETPLMVSLFDGRMAKTLLRSKLGQHVEWIEEDSDRLVEALEFLPLAITQAAAFIRENNTTVKKYTALLQASDSGLVNLLNQDLTDLRRDFDASSSIIRTWQVSFGQIQEQKPQAAELLSLMAVLDRQGIPEELLYGNNEEQTEIITALGTLQAFSLISSDKKGESFEMHRLVQLSTLKWLEMQNEKLKWQERALQLLSAKFPNASFGTWEICALYLPHVMVVIDSLILGQGHMNELGLLVNTANYLREQGQYKVAEQIIKRALRLYEMAYGKEHSDTLNNMKTLGEILNRQGKYSDAEKLLREVLVSRERILGGNHESTLSANGALASILINQGKYEEAKKMSEQNLKLLLETLGEDHQSTLANMGRLAMMYGYLHQFDKAEELQVQVLKNHKKSLGVENPFTLHSMASLAATYYKLNRLDEAEELDVQVLEKSTKVLGVEHPATLWKMANLASTYHNLNRLNDAEKLQVQVLEKRTKMLGAEHPDTLRSMANLAVTHFKMNQLDKAEDLQVHALEMSTKVLGAEHPDTLSMMAGLAATYFNMNRLDKAEELDVQVLEKSTKVLGEEHPDTLSMMANLARTWKEQDHLKKAISLMSDAVRLSEMVLGADGHKFKKRQRLLNRWMEESSQIIVRKATDTLKGAEISNEPSSSYL